MVRRVGLGMAAGVLLASVWAAGEAGADVRRGALAQVNPAYAHLFGPRVFAATKATEPGTPAVVRAASWGQLKAGLTAPPGSGR
ncbi:MAG: hypothetical protein AB1505_30260 [Candidatus Latescibacterota bacterium]